MSFHEILIAIMAGFALLGAVDRIFGNRWGLGKEFEEGILAMGSLALAMVGIVSLAPVLADVLKPVVVPIFGFLGADPAMFAGTILACDMGGGALALEMTDNYDAAMLGGVLNGSMLGATLVFTIPVAMGKIAAGHGQFIKVAQHGQIQLVECHNHHSCHIDKAIIVFFSANSNFFLLTAAGLRGILLAERMCEYAY